MLMVYPISPVLIGAHELERCLILQHLLETRPGRIDVRGGIPQSLEKPDRVARGGEATKQNPDNKIVLVWPLSNHRILTGTIVACRQNVPGSQSCDPGARRQGAWGKGVNRFSPELRNPSVHGLDFDVINIDISIPPGRADIHPCQCVVLQWHGDTLLDPRIQRHFLVVGQELTIFVP